MKSNNKQLVEVVGVIAVVASLLFVGSELRLARSIAVIDGLSSRSDLNLNFRSLIIENADIWERGCLGEELSDQESIIFANMAQVRINLGFNRWAQGNEGVSQLPNTDTARLLALNMYRFPGLRKAWDMNRLTQELESTPWSMDVEDHYNQLVQSGTSREFDVAWCGR